MREFARLIGWLVKRSICTLSFSVIHWSGRTDGGGMGDAVQCDYCKRDDYGPGYVIRDRAEGLSTVSRVGGFLGAALRVIILWLTLLFALQTIHYVVTKT